LPNFNLPYGGKIDPELAIHDPAMADLAGTDDGETPCGLLSYWMPTWIYAPAMKWRAA
jgi:hypothetical protein